MCVATCQNPENPENPQKQWKKRGNGFCTIWRENWNGLCARFGMQIRRKTHDNGYTHLLDSNRQHRCDIPRTNHHHIKTARRRRWRRKQSQVRPMCRLQMRLGRQERFCHAQVYWRGNSPHLSSVLALPLPLEPYTLPRCSPQALSPINRSVR